MGKQSTRKERFQNIYQAMEPLRIAKKSTIHTLAGIGRNHKILRYPILVFLFIFLFLYNFFLYILIHLRVHEKLAKGISVALCSCLVATSVSITVWAVSDTKRPGIALSSSSVGIVLNSGTYYVDSNVTITSNQGPAIDIVDGAEVIIYIDKGKTLKCVGGDGYCTVAKVAGEYKATMVQAGAGIHIPKNASLILMGEGSVNTEGGDGYANTSGHDATSGSYYRCKDASQSWVTSGRGGTGGTGAGAPAAGIGANGTNGREGEVSTAVTLTGSLNDTTIDAEDGRSTAGFTGETMGNLYVWDSVTVNAAAGGVQNAEVSGGKAANPVASSYKKYNGSSNEFRMVAAICGGGSGGGKVNGTPNAIGGALGGGGGGASGARGAVANMRKAGTWKSIGKLGLVSNYNDSGYTSHCNGLSSMGGHSGGLWDYSGKHLLGFSGNTGAQGDTGEGGMLCSYPSASVSGRSNSSKNKLVKAGITLKKDGETDTAWAKEQVITLCRKETNGTYTKLYRMYNVDFGTGKKSSTYYYQIPANTGKLYVFVNGIYTGQILNIQGSDLSDTVNAYTTTINLYGNLSPKTNSKVQFYDEGDPAYTFDEISEGVYEDVVVYRPNSEDNNNYEVYVDGKSTQKWLNVSASNHEMTINFYDLTVYITEDEINKGGQGVTLWRGDKLCYTMWEQEDSSYTYRLIAEKDAPEATGTYDIYLNGEDSGKDIDFSSVAKLTAEVPYITLRITLRKDDAAWNDATVRVINEAGEQFDLKCAGSGEYSEILPADTYMPVVSGVTGSMDLSNILSISNKALVMEYYTVTFHRNFAGMENLDTYQNYILKKGEFIPVPLKPAAGGASFSFWSSDEEGENGAYDFTVKISGKADIYAIWNLPSVQIGEEIRCTQSGETAGDGQYYKMSYLTLSGFDENYRISNIELDYTNMAGITLPVAEVVYEIFETVATNTEGIATERKVIHFENQITVKQAENFLRKIIVQPETGVEHTMQVTVYTEPAAE